MFNSPSKKRKRERKKREGFIFFFEEKRKTRIFALAYTTKLKLDSTIGNPDIPVNLPACPIEHSFNQQLPVLNNWWGIEQF